MEIFLTCEICVFRGKKTLPIVCQIARQVVKLNPSDLCLPSRAWKVKLLGEGADDAGGVFDDTITEMCQVRHDEARTTHQLLQLKLYSRALFDYWFVVSLCP